ncbi:MAG: hypothetical protein ILM98_10225, partial [Kiritimatiellae bacterium]|nr:hypothetical protein [Kiritimatiellia bacterium]
ERSDGGGDGEADGGCRPRRGARPQGVPGDRTERTGAGRRSPGMRRQPPHLADTERRERDGAASDW